MTNLTPAEEAEWKAKCSRQRNLARLAPCYHPGQALMECYKFSLGPWNFVLTLDRFISPPSWHGTVSYFKEIGSERVTDAEGRYIFDTPQDALMAVNSWNHEEYDTARDLLGMVFGELIHREDQRMIEHKGMFALHWLTSEKDAGTLDS